VPIREMRPEDAPAAASIHIEGQPGTFLSSLGEAFLRALYAELSCSPYGFGYVAEEKGVVMGVVAATTDTPALFKDMALRRGWRLALPLVGRLLRHPSLIGKVLQTFTYPGKEGHRPGQGELLFIGVRGQARRQGTGSRLVEALVRGCRERGLTDLVVTVDASNEGANHFYIAKGFVYVKDFELYGRRMNLYHLDLKSYRKEGDEIP